MADMTTFTVAWGRDDTLPNRQPDATVTTSAQLDAVLDQITQAGKPTVIDISPTDDGPDGAILQIGIGHPDHSFVQYLDADDAEQDLTAIGEPAHVPPNQEVMFDMAGTPIGCGLDRAMVSPKTARKAAHEYIRTGRRPTNVDWLQG